jgi:MiaB/RimO family radical SAM methylthiotransferase
MERRLKRADLIVLYTCGLTQLDGQISVDLMKKLESERKHDSEFLVWGCLPRIDPQLVARTHNGPILGRRDTHRLEEMIGSKVRYHDVTANHLFSESEDSKQIRSKYEPDPFTYLLEEINYEIRQSVASVTAEGIFYIMTGRGCLGDCSFCSDLCSCGRLESKPIEKVIAEFKQGLDQGYKRFFLVTTDLGVYGKDIGQDLSILLQKLIREQGDYRLLLPNVNPRSLSDMIGNLKSILRSGRIGLLGVPVQSGSERILKAMGRKHTAREFEESITAINAEFPDTTIWTQIMVGFPGETEEDFDATLNLLDKVAVDYVQVFRFSRRPTTRASYFENQVPESISLDRYRRALVEAIYKELSRRTLRFRALMPFS